MSIPNEPSARSTQLHATLLMYARSPGKFSVALRQPALLFASIPEILHLAIGHGLPAEEGSDPEIASIREAACFFIRTALLHPNADPHALLGLEPNAGVTELRERYRLLMRLIHPDFSGTASISWPDDAAARVNLAYETLSAALPRHGSQGHIVPAPQAARPRPPHRSRTAPTSGFHLSRLKQLLAISGVAGICAILISLMMVGPERHDLIQRIQRPGTEPLAEQLASANNGTSASPDADRPATASQRQASTRPASPASNAVSALQGKAAERLNAAPSNSESAQQSSSSAGNPGPTDAVAQTGNARQGSPALRSEPLAAPPAPAPTRTESAAALVKTSDTEVTPRPLLTTGSPSATAAGSRTATTATMTLGEAQPLLSAVLQQFESGRGERVVSMLDQEARNSPGAQAFLRQYNSSVAGARTVRLSRVEFRSEPAEGRLLVTSYLRLKLDDSPGSADKPMAFRAEFVLRDGIVVMTGLSGVPDN